MGAIGIGGYYQSSIGYYDSLGLWYVTARAYYALEIWSPLINPDITTTVTIPLDNSNSSGWFQYDDFILANFFCNDGVLGCGGDEWTGEYYEDLFPSTLIITNVPEMSTWLMIGLGFGILGLSRALKIRRLSITPSTRLAQWVCGDTLVLYPFAKRRCTPALLAPETLPALR